MAKRRISVFYLTIFIAIIIISVSAFAANPTITNTNNAGYQGVYLQDNGFYSITNTNYYVVQSAQAATTAPLAWANGASGYVNALVAADWDLAFTLTINAGGLTSHVYTITVFSTAANGAVTTLYTFTFTSPAVITPGQTMTIIWDTGATTWTAPAALTATIA
jgi:archaellum component FlaF (FlaF/FlaG flagellin family)